jgi:hypothetical protein
VLSEAESPLGYLLLRCLRSYLVIDMYAGLEVHTTETIAAGRAEVLNFSSLMKVNVLICAHGWTVWTNFLIQEYVEAAKDTDYGDKNWDAIIKIHLLNHIFNEIEAKGVTRNYNTKPNEKLHGPLKKHYLRRTNFKDIAPQVETTAYTLVV